MGIEIQIGILVLVLGVAGGMLARRLLRGWVGRPFHESSGLSESLTGEEIAFLLGGRRRLLSVLVTRLRRAGQASFDTGYLRPGRLSVPDEASEIERALGDALLRQRNLDLGAVRSATRKEIAAIHRRLGQSGLALHGTNGYANRIGGAVPLLVGAGYLFSRAAALPSGHEDLFAICAFAMSAIALAIVMLFAGSRATMLGLESVKQIAESHPLHPTATERDQLDPNELAIYAAIHGEPYWGPDVSRFLSGAGKLRDEPFDPFSPDARS